MMSRFAFVSQNENTSITTSGTKNSSPRRRTTGAIGDSSRSRMRRPRETTVGGVASTPPTASTVMSGGSRAEDLVEQLDRLRCRRARALEDHVREHVAGFAIEVAIGLILLALVHEERVGLLVEQGSAVDE